MAENRYQAYSRHGSSATSDLPDGQFCEIGVQPCNEKYFACAVGQISGTESGCLASIRGTYVSSRTLRWDAVDAKVLRDERHYRGRQNRVVLTPRRWRQVFVELFLRERRWQKSPVTGY